MLKILEPELPQLLECELHRLSWHNKVLPAANIMDSTSSQCGAKVLVEGYLANATITTWRSCKNNSFAPGNMCGLVHGRNQKSTISVHHHASKLNITMTEPPQPSLGIDEHTTESMRAVEGKTAVPPGT